MLSAIFTNAILRWSNGFWKDCKQKSRHFLLNVTEIYQISTNLNEKRIVAKEFQCFNWGHDIQICTFKNDNLTVQLF